MKRISLATALLFASLAFASASAQGTAALANSGGAEGASDVGKNANMDQLMNQQVGSIRFYGKVAVVDGVRPLWDPIPISVTCDGKVLYNTTADSSGGFNIEAVPRQSEVVTVKSDLKHITPAQLVGCTVSASLDGFKSSKLLIANASVTDNPAIGTVTLSPDPAARGSVTSSTTVSAPADAIKDFEKAHEEQVARHPAAARKLLQKAVSIDPQFAEAWFHLGQIEEDDKPDDALNAYTRAVAADSQYIPPYVHIAALDASRKDWKGVLNATQHSLELNSEGSPEVWYFDAVGKFNSGDTDGAQTSALKALAMDPNHLAPKTEQLLAVVEAGQGNLQEALEHLRSCLSYTPPGPDADLMKKQIAQIESAVSRQSQ